MAEKPNFSGFKRAFSREAGRRVAKQRRIENAQQVMMEAEDRSEEDTSADEDSSGDDLQGNSSDEGHVVHGSDDDSDEAVPQDGDGGGDDGDAGGGGDDGDVDSGDDGDNDVNDDDGDDDDGGGSSDGSDDGSTDADDSSNNNSESSDDQNNDVSDGELEDDNLHFEDDNAREQYLLEGIRTWALKGGTLSMRKLDKLLALFHRVFPNIPLSYKTLLHTPVSVPLIHVHNGKIWYKGIRNNLDPLNFQEYVNRHNSIKIDINIDGIPLFKSSKKKFYCILGRLVGSKNAPFIISIYLGTQDPDPADILRDFVEEYNDLRENGLNVGGNHYEFEVRHYICDAKARSQVKCIIEHGGRCACEKCEVEGEWISRRMTFCDLNARLRTDESFQNARQPDHHTGVSPLAETDWRPVSQFRLDGMHLVHLGVFKRLLSAWRKWNGPWKLHLVVVEQISDAMEALKECCPTDFNRPPRRLTDMAYFKATEYRRSLLYEGALVFRDHQNANVYRHFLLLHCAIFILSSPLLVQQRVDEANEMLRLFITHSIQIYGAKFVVYNVHSLCHLSAECREHGHLDSFSAYPFEDKLGRIKSSLKSGYKPLQQAAKRDLEKPADEIILEGNDNDLELAQPWHVPNEIINGTHFKYLKVHCTTFKIGNRDSCFVTSDGEVIILRNIVRRGNAIYLVGYAFEATGNLYEYPIPSSDLGILTVSQQSDERRAHPLTSVHAKGWLMPDGDNFVFFPLLHTTPLFV